MSRGDYVDRSTPHWHHRSHGTPAVGTRTRDSPTARSDRRVVEHPELAEHPRRVSLRPRSVRNLVRPPGSHSPDGRHGRARCVSSGAPGGRGRRLHDPTAMVRVVIVLRLRRATGVACDQSSDRRRSAQGRARGSESDGATVRRGSGQLPRCSCSPRSAPRSARRPARCRWPESRRSTRARHRARVWQATRRDDHRPAPQRDEAHRARPQQRSCRSAMHRHPSQRPRLRQRTVVQDRCPATAHTLRRRSPHPPTQSRRRNRTRHGQRVATIPHQHQSSARHPPRRHPTRSRPRGPAQCAALRPSRRRRRLPQRRPRRRPPCHPPKTPSREVGAFTVMEIDIEEGPAFAIARCPPCAG